jgi:hypothetical protein
MTFQKALIAILLLLSPLAIAGNGNQPTFKQKSNWVSELPREQIVRMLGAPAPTDSLDYSGVEVNSNLPASIDWRNKDGVNYLGKVMNQGNCGSCVAFASVATLEGQVSISTGMPGLSPTFSPQMLFACGGGGCDRGWFPGAAANQLKSSGVADEACMPYTSGSTGDDASCSNRCADSSARSFKIVDFNKPSGGIFGGGKGSIESVKAALLKGPLLTTLNVYEDFLTYSSGVYLHKNGSSVGGHAVSLVGYDDSKQAWLVRNSWGEEYGEKGYVWVSYADKSGIGSQTWSFELAPQNGMIAVTSPSDRQFVSGKQDLTIAGDTSAEFFLVGSNGKNVSIDCVNGSVMKDQKLCTTSLETNTLSEGRYEIYAQSKTTKAKSQVREFFVVNSLPKMEVSFSPVSGLDLTKPVKGRPEFTVKTKTSSAVPLQYVEFRVLDSNGNIVSRKGNGYVLSDMKMGWRSNTVPNGNYSILFHGEITVNGKVYGVDSPAIKIAVKN